MAESQTFESKIYALNDSRSLSVRDLFEYFSRHGSMRVSDLHIKVGTPPTYRVDGQLLKMKGPPMSKDTVKFIVSLLLSDREMEELTGMRSVDSAITVGANQFRMNIFFDSDGPALAVRALESSPPPVEQVGFPNDVWRDVLRKQQGLVIVAGVTGSGKSTTISSMINRIAETRPVRVITLEDPIEYKLESKTAIISQRELGRDVPSYESGVRDALREDPDVIFVGEMRDRDAASWTLSAAETGHLVFSTLHTRDCRGTITRLIDMFPSDRADEIASQISLALSHIICQKLIPRASGDGRVVAMEIMNNNYATSNLIRMRKIEQLYSTLQTHTKNVSEERMCTMERSLANLVRYGIITPHEAEKWCNDWSSFANEMEHVYAEMEDSDEDVNF